MFLLTYAKAKPDLASKAIPILIADLEDPSPLIRALALRTMSAIPVKEFFDAVVDRIPFALQDHDPYVRKTAAFSVAKLWNHDSKVIEEKGFINDLNKLLGNSNPTVVAAALAALNDISEKSPSLQLSIDRTHAFNLAHVIPDCNEWSQSYIITALMNYVPQTSSDAVIMIERMTPRLQHANSSVVLGAIRLIVYLSNYVSDLNNAIPHLDRKIGPAFVILLQKPPEIQYLALRNCILLLQSRPQLLSLDVKVFLCKYNDPIYVKATKLEIIFLLADERNIRTVLRELQECATEIDVQVVRKSVRAIGKLAIKIEKAAEACLEALIDLVSTNVSYIVQEATVVIKNIFRRYPNRYEGVISTLCEHLDSLDEPEAKAAMIWIIGHYADRIENADELLENFLANFKQDTVEVQLALLTAIVKLFIARPAKAQSLVPKVLGWATEESDNPDVRDRGYMYWRLLSADPKAAKGIVTGEMPLITADSDRMDDERLEELELCIGSLATIYLKPVKQVFRLAKVRTLPESPALAPRMLLKKPDLVTQKSTPNLKRASTVLGTTSVSTNTSGYADSFASTAGIKPGLARSQTLSTAMGGLSLRRDNGSHPNLSLSTTGALGGSLVDSSNNTPSQNFFQPQLPFQQQTQIPPLQPQQTAQTLQMSGHGFQRQPSMNMIHDPTAGGLLDAGPSYQTGTTANTGLPPTSVATQNSFYTTGHNASSSGFVNMTTLPNNTSYSQSESLIGDSLTGAGAPQQQQYQQYLTQQPQQFQYHQQPPMPQQPQQQQSYLNGQNGSSHDLLF